MEDTPTLYPYTLNELLVHVRDLSLSFGTKQILRDINFDILNIVRPGTQQGQCIALLGPSGIGKTQLFRCLAGLQKPTTGTILIDVDQRPVKAGEVAVVAQDYPLMEHRTVLGNLLLAAKCAGLKGNEIKERVQAIATLFRIEDHLNKYPIQLSGGQRQRVAIAQQLLMPNHLILMDEPFSGLDTVMIDRVCKTLHSVLNTDELITIIVVTHDISAAVRVADTLYLMGRDPDKEGATIKYTTNLIERGLAWHPNITRMSEYAIVQREIRDVFETL